MLYLLFSQTLQVKVGSNRIESHSDEPPVDVSKGLIKYGPYNNMPPYAFSKLRVHFLNHYPFATFTNVEREIEVSHWGNVAVEELYDIAHTGAKLTGGFSRVDFNKRR